MFFRSREVYLRLAWHLLEVSVMFTWGLLTVRLLISSKPHETLKHAIHEHIIWPAETSTLWKPSMSSEAVIELVMTHFLCRNSIAILTDNKPSDMIRHLKILIHFFKGSIIKISDTMKLRKTISYGHTIRTNLEFWWTYIKGRIHPIIHWRIQDW